MNRWLKLAFCAALFLIVFGGRLWLIDRCGTDVPSWDQWDGIGGTLFLPYFSHTLSAGDLVAPHNEHRILFTRLLSLGLLLANGQWDNRLESVVNAGVMSLTAVLLFWMILRWGPPRVAVPLGFPAIALMFILPFSWENTLFGFQSQFFFLILFSIASIALLVLNPPGTRRWAAGWLLGALAIFTTGSGVLAAGAVLCFTAFEGMRRSQSWKAASVTMGAAVIIILLGWAMNVTVERHQVLRAHSLLQWVTALGQNLSWPNLICPNLAYPWLIARYIWLDLLNWLPFILLAWAYARSPGEYAKLERVTLALGIWVVMQSAAMAYARGGPSWRYMDIMSLGWLVNAVAIGLVLSRPHAPRVTGRLIAVFLLWTMIGGAGLAALIQQAVRVEIPRHMYMLGVKDLNIRAFMATGDERCLTGKSSEEISFPASSPWVITCLLRDQHIQDILPAGIRRPLRLDPKTSYGHAFVTNGVAPEVAVADDETVWGSYSSQGPAAEGAWVSQPLATRFPFLRFEVAGDLGQDYLVMKLAGISRSRDLWLHPAAIAGSSWTPLLVRAPADSFAIEAIDDHAQRWFAFKAPREVGGLSWLASRLAQAGSVILAAGLLLFGLLAMGRYFQGLGRGPVSAAVR